MKSVLRTVNNHGKVYQALLFVCPGCVAGGPDGYDGLHLLPVNVSNLSKPSWSWNGNLKKPTLTPSILSQGYCRCHSYLTKGIFQFLDDSDHSLAGQFVPIPDLPDWVKEMYIHKGDKGG